MAGVASGWAGTGPGSLTVGGICFGSVMTLVASCALELDTLFADGEISIQNGLGDCVKSIVEIEIDQTSLPVFQLVQSRGFLEVTTEIGELVIPPYLLEAKLIPLLLVPGVVKVELSGIFAAILLSLICFSLTLIWLFVPRLLGLLLSPYPTQQREQIPASRQVCLCQPDRQV